VRWSPRTDGTGSVFSSTDGVGDIDGAGGGAGNGGRRCWARVSDGGGSASLPPKLAMNYPLSPSVSGSRMGRRRGGLGFYTKGPLVPIGITNRD
jgi:hypothetical protein